VDFSQARFERAGAWGGGALLHVYGADAGFFRYRFTAPLRSDQRAPAAVQIEARLSSEWPGTSAPPDGGSLVRVLIDDTLVGTRAVIPDDGIGRMEKIDIDDPAVLRGLAQGRGVHTLTFEVPFSASVRQAHGLCIYGDATGKEKLPPGDYHPILIHYLPPAAAERDLREAPAP
jgi:hypothetical protein